MIFFYWLGAGLFDKAESIYQENQDFFNILVKTRKFLYEFEECLINCDNAYQGGDGHRCNNYIKFLIEEGLISDSFKQYTFAISWRSFKSYTKQGVTSST